MLHVGLNLVRDDVPARNTAATSARIAPYALHSFVMFDADGAAAGEAAAEAFRQYFAIGMS